VLKSTYHGKTTLDLSPFVVDEITIVGSRCGPFAPALRLLERGEVDTSGLIGEVFPLGQGTDAVLAAQEHGAMKMLLSMKSESGYAE